MTIVTSPVSGRVLPLAAVPDPVFAQAMVGVGVAVEPARPEEAGTALEAVAPVDGVVVAMHPHAFVVVDAEGRGVLTHLGIDTVQLNGEGCVPLARKGDAVARGQVVVRWDPAPAEAAGLSLLCPVVGLQAVAGSLTELRGDGLVRAGDRLFVWR